jgi:putative flippase GtrA
MRTGKHERSQNLGADEASPHDVVRALLWDKTDHTLLQLFRYTCVGGIAFLVDISTLFVLTEFFGIYYLISAAIAFLLGLITNYSASVLWVFKRHTLRSRFLEFVTFSLIGLLGLALNEFFLWFFTERIAIHYLLSKIISAFLVYLFNFTSRKIMLFR